MARATSALYPRLFVRLEHRYDTLTFREGDAYPQSSGHWFRLQKVIFYLSDFKVFRNSDVFGVTDSLKMKVFGPATADTLDQYLTNDFVLVRRTPLEFAAGAFPESGTFDRVRCRLGLPDARQQYQDSKTRDGIHRIFSKAQEGNQVLHMSGLQKSKATVLHKRHIPPAKLRLERTRAIDDGTPQDFGDARV